ncbi:L-aspartate oxidase [Frankia sp. CNm7]|uniref:L-aspartate oxidase n=1 Tax=Frankia nepalensis TaxID=1836974 RepID=A0A937RGE9_9ACTN|nr:L-aspartate oxidase [Frankia nepalensis]MBL7501365.1 L-aspartate oxidase [Frankia nepalensis]MBL7509848.1 L-aspartate oxidase [Frankia nepalensis]MBL7524346.1 L-aspartate oxidase [Frankia nepalensis]MBL7629607.1 L-aspartate oxidase [Frankia nepalensis]
MPVLPTRLGAPRAGWTRHADVVVIGSGVAGLTAVLRVRAALPASRVLLVTKALLDEGSTRWAQGGIAAALAAEDSPDDHLRDTLVAGVGLCDPEAVRVLVTEGPGRVRELAALGARFDRTAAGELSLTREGGHLRNRIVHAGGDATGLEVERALIAALRADEGVEVIEHALVLDLLVDADGHAAGATLHVLGEGTRDGVGAVTARAVVLATGGMGQIYASTTNPPVSTGDGVALALRAGAVVTDLEFVQFHPTALRVGNAGSAGQQPLVSEAMRGEGAVLVDAAGERVMDGVHPLADLAPRDVVAKQMSRVMAAQGVDHLYLDARHLGERTILRRFPTITAQCRSHGIDPVTQPIPVAPAAHYASGGVRADTWGRTSVPGLYACGEVACTGVHGANRLASNSLLEGLVFAARIAEHLSGGLPSPGAPAETAAGRASAGLADPGERGDLARTMTDGAGVLRGAPSLVATAKALAGIGDVRLTRATVTAGPEAWEMTNLRTVATALVAAAAARTETRGSHWREDFADADAAWRGHLLARLDPDGALGVTFEPAPADETDGGKTP